MDLGSFRGGDFGNAARTEGCELMVEFHAFVI